MKIALILLAIGVILLLYAYLSYCRIQKGLRTLKEEDLVSYYLDLFYQLLPVPFWSAVAGLVLVVTSLIIGGVDLVLQLNH